MLETEEREEPYTPNDLLEHAEKNSSEFDTDGVRLGLYLVVDFGGLGTNKRTEDGVDIESLTIPESILSILNPEKIWDDRMAGAKNQAKGMLFPQVEVELPFELEDSGPPPIPGTKDWYFEESVRTQQKTLRCPFAMPDLCPRYFDSVSFSGKLGATEMSPCDTQRLEAKWRNSPPFAVLSEQLPSVQGGADSWGILSNFCPEVTYELHGVFASVLGNYVDEIDQDNAHRRLSRQKAPPHDPAWSWGFVSPLHYTSCPTFSVLAGSTPNGGGTPQGLLDALLLIPGVDGKYVTQQVERMTTSVFKDPALAIGTAKEIVETCCKTILADLKVSDGGAPKLPALVKLTNNSLVDRLPKSNGASDANRLISNALQTLVNGLSELRNLHGTGHGQASRSGEIGSRQAKLAVGAAATLCIYLAETHSEIATQP